MIGWIKLHKKLLDFEWYSDINTMRVFIHILLKTNYEPSQWKGIELQAGQMVTGRKSLSIETGLSEQQIRRSINNLQNSQVITIKTTKKYSIVTVEKWALYQKEQPTEQPQNNQQSNRKTTTVKEVKKKEDIEDKINKFKIECQSYKSKYSYDMCKAFFTYWSELNKSGNKMRCEMEKTWETHKRLATWSNNKFK